MAPDDKCISSHAAELMYVVIVMTIALIREKSSCTH